MGGGTVGFIGIGSMGVPMALHLVRAGYDLLIWNRTPAKTASVVAAGAKLADDADQVFATADVIILMLANGAAIDAVLGRGEEGFVRRVAGRTIVHMGTTSPEYSLGLETDLVAAGAAYVEAPVSGSRKPAEAGRLLALLAGDPTAVDRVRPIIEPMTAATFVCGATPGATLMKLAANIYLIGEVVALAEATHFAGRAGLDLALFDEILQSGQMASEITRVKTPKLIARDFAPQAAVVNVLDNNHLIAEAAQLRGIAVPLISLCRALFDQALEAGHGDDDMVAVVTSIEARSRLQ
jgi:3-hydroxyisobutyrate dehydrogenase